MKSIGITDTVHQTNSISILKYRMKVYLQHTATTNSQKKTV